MCGGRWCLEWPWTTDYTGERQCHSPEDAMVPVLGSFCHRVADGSYHFEHQEGMYGY
jgi:hypothetical protein